jgi:large subunit ribosomal protein L32e
MVEKETKRNKPKFFRQTWHKMIKLGKTVKKKRKWRNAYGRHSKVRLNKRNHPMKPTIGWGSSNEMRNLIEGMKFIRVENVKQLNNVPKGFSILIGSIGKKKKIEILNKAKEMKIEVLNRYREEIK